MNMWRWFGLFWAAWLLVYVWPVITDGRVWRFLLRRPRP
jgi:hypothetical protein